MKKTIRLIALILGVALIIAGVAFLFHSDSHTGYGGGVSRASTSIKFGADFYTSSAQYTGLAANAVTDLYAIVKTAIGIFFIFLGATDCCAILYFTNEENKALVTPKEIGTVLIKKEEEKNGTDDEERSNQDAEQQTTQVS